MTGAGETVGDGAGGRGLTLKRTKRKLIHSSQRKGTREGYKVKCRFK